MQSRTGIIVVLLLCLVACTLIAGCTQQPPVPPPTPAATSPTSQLTACLANPASVNCGNSGGRTEIRKNSDGSEYGMCTFINGTSCEEWTLFRSEGCKPGVTGTAPQPH